MSSLYLCTAKPEYNWEEKLKKLEPHEWEKWRLAAKSLATELAKPGVNQASFKPDYWGSHNGLMMDGDEVEAWTEAGIELTMTRVKGLASNSGRPADIIYQISVANVGLMNIQLAEVLENACTDELQRWLDKGWRILAVCPPNDARRPTYVMGHFSREGHN